MGEFDGYSWIKVKRYKMDESLSWEERYEQLDQHHVKETTFLIDKVREVAQQRDSLRKQLNAAQLKLMEYQKREARRYRQDQDYLDYEERDR